MAALTLRVLTHAGDTTINVPLSNSQIDQNFINIDDELATKANNTNPVLAGTDGMVVPVGTTGQRPVGTAGQFRYNTSTFQFEGFYGSTPAWTPLVSVALTDDTTTNANTFYPLMAANQTTGTAAAARVSSTKLYFNPSTGTLSTTTFNSLSDANLKTNVNTVDNALNLVRQLRGVTFNWKDSGQASYGVIAQELIRVLPELVTDGDVKTVNYDGIIAVLIQAIQELDASVQKLSGAK